MTSEEPDTAAKILDDVMRAAIERAKRSRRKYDKSHVNQNSILRDITDHGTWGRARRRGQLPEATLEMVVNKASPDPQVRRAFMDRWLLHAASKLRPSVHQADFRNLRHRIKIGSDKWVWAVSQLLDSRGLSPSALLSYDLNLVIPDIVYRERDRNNDDAALRNAFAIMQALYARLLQNRLKDHRALLLAIFTLIDVAAIAGSLIGLNAALEMIRELRKMVKADPFLDCLILECNANIREYHAQDAYLKDARDLFDQEATLAAKMADSRVCASEWPALHVERVGAFLNSANLHVKLGASMSDIAGLVDRWRDVASKISDTNDPSPQEFSGNEWHAELFANAKLNRRNRLRSYRGGDPEGALEEVECVFRRHDGFQGMLSGNVTKLMRIKLEALRCLGRNQEHDAALEMYRSRKGASQAAGT